MERMAFIWPLGFGTPSSMASRFKLIKSVIMIVKGSKHSKQASQSAPSEEPNAGGAVNMFPRA